MKKEYWQDGTGNYVKIIVEKENFGDKIFSYQDMKGFLPMEMRRINGQLEAIYTISGKISLRNYLAKSDWGLEEIRQLFFQLFEMTDRVEEYLLDSEGILMDADNLYVDMISGELEGIYRGEQRKNIVEAISGLLETIMEKMNQRDKELVFFIYGMHKRTKEYGCTKEILRNYVMESGEAIELRNEWKTESAEVCEKIDSFSQQYNKKRKCSRKIIIKGCFLPGMILAAGVTFPSVLWWMGIFRKPLSGEIDGAKVIGAIAFFLVVTAYGIWKTWPEQWKNKKEKGISFHKDDVDEKNVCLIPQTGADGPIPIQEFPYSFEKNKGDVRARIFRENGNVVVVDEESREGTFFNDKRLIPWQKVTLNDGDILRVYGREYVVEITQPAYVI